MARKSPSNNLKPIQAITLRKKTGAKASLLVKMGTMNFQLPVDVQVVRAGSDVYVSIPHTSSIFGVEDGSKALAAIGDQQVAYKRLLSASRTRKESGGGRRRAADLDPETENLMRQLEAKLKSQGLKPAVDLKSGKLRAAKPRTRRGKADAATAKPAAAAPKGRKK